MGISNYIRFLKLRVHLGFAAKNASWEELLFPVQIPTKFKDMDEQLKSAQKKVEIKDRRNRKFYVTLPQHFLDHPGGSYAQDQIFAKKKQNDKFQLSFHMSFILMKIRTYSM